MDWTEIVIWTTTEGVEPVTGLVLMAGINGLVVDDPKDLSDFLASPLGARWDYADESLLGDPDRETVIRAYVGDHEQGLRQWEYLRQALVSLKDGDAEGRFGSLGWSQRKVKEEDWANNWKAFFKPFPVGEMMVVKPTWETWDDRDGRLVLEIDPGSSFGSGQHHTTRMCLEFMERYVTPGTYVLDIGCGSGILMIAGLLLGAGYATGVDVDENAVRTAEGNLRQNALAPDRYALYCGDLAAEPELRRKLGGAKNRAHLITANIVADVILGLAPYFSELMFPEGRLLASGIIDDRRQETIRELAKSGFALEEEKRSGEWHAMVFRLQTGRKGY